MKPHMVWMAKPKFGLATQVTTHSVLRYWLWLGFVTFGLGLEVGCAAVLTLATRMFVINEKLFLFAIVDRYPFATCAKDIFV